MASNLLYQGIPAPANVSALQALRAGYTGEQMTSDAQGRYFEATRLGTVFHLDSGAVTLAAANATGSVLGTLKLIVGFYNPTNSNVLASVLWANVTTQSGTPGGGFLHSFVIPGGRVSSTATGTFRSGYLSSAAANTPLVPLVNVAVATIPADTATADTLLCTLGGPTAVAATGANEGASEEVAGRIIVPPGVIYGLTCAAAGTTHVVRASLAVQQISTQ